MGAYLSYLSKPITDKEITDEIGDRVICGTSSMQGWRITQEDAHNCIVNYDTNASLFAVYDGHGGHDVAIYSAQHLPKYLKNCEAYKKGDYTQALKDAFLEFDASLIEPEVLTILRRLAKKKKDSNKSSSEEDEEEENVENLYEEADMPLEQVMAKYHNDLVNNTNKIRDADKGSCSSGASSSRAGSSSSKCRRNHITEPDSEEEEDCNVKKKEDEVCGSSSSSKQAESNTNNGDSKSVETVKSEEDAKVANVEKSGNEKLVSDKSEDMKVSDKSEDKVSDKSEDMKVSDKSEDKKVSDKSEDKKISDKSEDIKVSDKSEDIKVSDKSEDIKVSDKPKDIKVKKNNSGDENSLGVEVNGEIGDEEKKGVNGDVADDGGNKGKGKVRISPSLRRRCATVLYRSLLENQDNSDSDSDDEGDESFQGAENSSDDDDDDDEDDDGGGNEEEEEEDENGDEEGEDEEAVDDDEDVGGFGCTKPGLESGCTAVVALLKGQELYVANAGDSRCVVCRKGQAIEMSLDHKPEDDIERSRILKAGGKISDGRVNGGLNLSRALGDHTYKKCKDLPAEEQMITALPDVRTLMIDPAEDEFMILACDGIWNSLSSQEVVDFVRERIQKGETKLSNICGELFDHCLAADTFCDGTGCDNMTAVIVQFKPELANSNSSKSVKREASPIESDSNKRLRTEETENV